MLRLVCELLPRYHTVAARLRFPSWTCHMCEQKSKWQNDQDE